MDIIFTKAYLKDEDMTFDLAGGSVSIQSNIWDLDIVNGRVQIPYLMSNAISESVLSFIILDQR